MREGWQGPSRGGVLPSHVGVQVPQGLRGIWGGVHVGSRLTEGIGSCFLGLDATSSPAFPIQPLGDVLEVPSMVRGALETSHPFLRRVPPFTTNNQGLGVLQSPRLCPCVSSACHA